MGNIPQFVIAAPSSGAGKTTVARGLMSLLRGHGLAVQPFKCGPDYIDTKFHAAVCGRPSVNLDLFMAGERHVRALYGHYSVGADVCVVEGMMGMYDGYDRSLGSTADIARVLGLPVVLVADARSAAYSLAPLLYGFTRFDSSVTVAGVIFNKVGSERHRQMLRRVCSDLGIECFGFLPRRASGGHPSRYLGLDFSVGAADGVTAAIDDNIDWRHLLAAVSRPCPDKVSPWSGLPCIGGNIVVAQSDEAFSFLYQEHIDMLRAMGRVTVLDPESDEPLPADTSLLYLPGGYPENRASELSAARRTINSICAYAGRGGRVLAECGGMMYLCRSIATDDGVHEMAGVLPHDITARTADRRLSLGYRRFALAGRTVSGHEFHYSRFAGGEPQSITQVYNAAGEPVSSAILRTGNVIAGYTHVYWGGEIAPTDFFGAVDE